MEGFFSESELITTSFHIPLSTKCGKCGLYKQCHSPKIPVNSKGKKGILLIGEAPGQTEDEEGKFFIGKSGSFLWERLSKFGIKRQDCSITNALICRPPNNRKPTSQEIEHCRANVFNVIKERQPHVIIPMGEAAIESLIRPMWKGTIDSVSRWVGWQIPDQKLNAWICPNFHPSYLLRQQRGEFGKEAISKYGREGHPVLNRLFDKYLQQAVSKKERPWKTIPDYTTEVEVLYNPKDIYAAIKDIYKAKKVTAFDYETTGLKPEWGYSKIICCSLSNGTRTIAYPWKGKAIEATKRLLESDIPKVASNMKFETRWSVCKNTFGTRIRNWYWDTMLASHWMDYRTGITSIKFLSYVYFGLEKYDKHIEPFLKSNAPNEPNNIHKIDMQSLLLYCGLDSLLEWKVAEVQIKETGYADQNFGF